MNDKLLLFAAQILGENTQNFPSMGQWWDILSNLGGIDLTSYQNKTYSFTSIPDAAPIAVANMNTYLQKIGDATQFSTDTDFWSSSEYVRYRACNVAFTNNGYLRLHYDDKYSSRGRVRCSFAF